MGLEVLNSTAAGSQLRVRSGSGCAGASRAGWDGGHSQAHALNPPQELLPGVTTIQIAGVMGHWGAPGLPAAVGSSNRHPTFPRELKEVLQVSQGLP